MSWARNAYVNVRAAVRETKTFATARYAADRAHTRSASARKRRAAAMIKKSAKSAAAGPAELPQPSTLLEADPEYRFCRPAVVCPVEPSKVPVIDSWSTITSCHGR